MGLPTYVNQTGKNGGGGSLTHVMTTPTGTAQGDVGFIFVNVANATTPTISNTSGNAWALVPSDTNPNSANANTNGFLFYKIFDTTPDASYTVTIGASGAPTIIFATFSPAAGESFDNATLFDPGTPEGHVQTGTTMTVPAVTTTNTNTMSLCVHGCLNDGTTLSTVAAGTVPATYTQINLYQSNLKGSMWYQAQAAAGSSGTKTFTMSASRAQLGFNLNFRSAGGAAAASLHPARRSMQHMLVR